MEEKEDQISNGTVMEITQEEQSETNAVMEITQKEQSETDIVGSEEMELNISHILEKIDRFTQLVTIINHNPFDFTYAAVHNYFNYSFSYILMEVSDLLESGKTMFKDLSNEFVERLFM